MLSIQRFQKKTRNYTTVLAFLSLSVIGLTGCDFAKDQLSTDREGGLSTQDYREALSGRVDETSPNSLDSMSQSIPDLQPYVAQSNSRMKPMPLVSISINQSVPLKDALYELATQAEYDIELDPRIRGGIIFTARNRPFDQVVERISDIAGLKYTFDDDSVRIELDLPYSKVYKIDYLNYIRESASEITNDVSVVSGDGADSGSKFKASSISQNDFWAELDANLQHIISTSDARVLKTNNDTRIAVVNRVTNVQSLIPADALPSESEGGEQAEGGQNTPTAEEQDVLGLGQLPPTLIEESLPTEEDLTAEAGVEELPLPTFSINKQAGLINIFANDRIHKEAAEYFKLLRKSVTSQVLIEAKVLEVTLNDEFATGIDWAALSLLSGELTIDFLTDGVTRPVSNIVPSTASGFGTSVSAASGSKSFVAGYAGNDIQALIQAVSGFGTVKALASPRLTVLNNQSAVLNVATNRVFFNLDVEVTQEEGQTQTTVDSEIQNVPEGVLVNVLPSINLEDNTVSMALRPTITRVINTVPDPAVTFVLANAGLPVDQVQSLIPELNVQEIDSVIKMRSGQAVVLGGLLQDRAISSETGIPVISEAPIVGSLFKDHNDLVQKTELVIFLKATILNSPSDSVDQADIDLYNKFSSDRRPISF